MITKICPQCNKSFTTEYKTQKLCSRACAFLSMSRKIHVTCPICGKDMYIHKGDKKFCSLKCAGVAKHLAATVTKTCPVCNKPFESRAKIQQQFCSTKCASIGRGYTCPTLTEEERTRRGNKLRERWQEEEFRQSVVNRMRTNNPVYMQGVVEKASATRHKNNSYNNNFKYGNGHVSPYEQIAKEKLEPLGFVYNYAIPTRLARDADPNAHYAINYKPDFVNLDRMLCIEIDGYGHVSPKEKLVDAKKEKCLNFLGFQVIRFTHEDIDQGVFDQWLNFYRKNM